MPASTLQNRGIVLSQTIGQEYEVNYAVRLDQYSTEFATAYEARERAPNSSNQGFYALIYNKFYPADLDKMNILRQIKDKHIQEVMDFGRIQGQKGEVLCCILKKPVGTKLKDIIRQSGALDEGFVLTQMFNQLAAALNTLHTNGIMHGSINLDNIYYNPANASILLKESISEFVGYSQSVVYETIERMVTHPAGKSNREPSADYYAAGVLVSSLLIGEEPMVGITADIVRRIKFENGSYDAIFGMAKTKQNIEFNTKTENLLRGLLHDKIADRWSEKQVTSWRKREINQSSPSRVHKQASTAFNFEDVEYFSPKYLAYTIQQNWSVAKKNLKITDLARWLSFTSRIPDIEKKIFFMTRSGHAEVIVPDDKVSRIIYLLDEEGPIRYKDYAFHPDGMGNAFAYFLFKNDHAGIDAISTAIDLGFVEGWIAQQENQEPYKANVMGWNPRKIKTYLRKNELGFGMERVLYELNPYLPCLSPLLENVYAVGLGAVLMALNQGRLNNKDIDNDKHLAAYISFQIDVEDSIRVKQLQPYPYFNKALPIQLAAMFAFAQKKAGIDNLSGIAVWVRQNLNSVIERLNSNNIRKHVTEKLDQAVTTGDINKLFAIISDAKLIRRDVFGFAEAKKQYKILTFEMLKLRSQHNLDQLAYRLGLRVSVVFSYLICSIAILSVLILSL